MSFLTKLRALSAEAAPSMNEWRPTLFDRTSDASTQALEGLIASRRVVFVHDTIDDQLKELLQTRALPGRPSGPELDALVLAHLAGTPIDEYGTWVYYPWSRSLVHVLPKAEYRELRSSRNAYKITPREQQRLRNFTIGIVGLSVGSSSAVTFALEGVGGRFRLTDFDALSLSNMNRLRASVRSIGVNKCVIAAREMFEIDPYLDIEIFPEGVTKGSLDAFLIGGGPLDLLVEECDDLLVKVLVRERARAYRIPVMMETSDRGMLDIERFDREPDRPLFHGLVGAVRAEDVQGLSPREKVPLIMSILGQSGVPARTIASVLEVQLTLASWPQLASSVTLGGALTTDAARKILLGQMSQSGRFFTDLDAIIHDGAAVDLADARAFDDALERRGPVRIELPRFQRVEGRVTETDIRRVAAFGILAPSRGNAQPWKLVARMPSLLRPARIRCFADSPSSPLDVGGSLSLIAVGAAVENMDLAARAMGLRPRVSPFPEPARASVVCDVFLEPDPTVEAPPLASAIVNRITSRKPGPREVLPPGAARALVEAAAAAGGELRWLADAEVQREVFALVGAVNRLMMLTQPLHEELMRELRWTAGSVDETRDGIDVASLDVAKDDLLRVWLMRSWPAMELLASLGAGRGLEIGPQMLLGASSGLALLSASGRGPEAYFRGGRALERTWLTATSLGLWFHPMTDLIGGLALAERGAEAGLPVDVVAALQDIRRRWQRVARLPDEASPIALLRVHRGGPPSARSRRRPLSSVLAFEGPRRPRAGG